MRNIVSLYVDKFRYEKSKQFKLTCLLMVLALFVTLGVFWKLHYTGIALTNETYCGYEEHTHSDDCYDENGILICELEEHTHTTACLSDVTADIETADDWEATLPSLTGNTAFDVVSIAKSQIGYKESTANFILADDGETRKGYTRYGAWYGNEYGDWDAMFAAFCIDYAGADDEGFPIGSGAYAWMLNLEELDLFADVTYTPTAGDLVFFDLDSDGKADHVGIISSVSDSTLTVIEGDSNDTVEQNTYSMSSNSILGYGLVSQDSSQMNVDTVQSLIDALPTVNEIETMDSDEQLSVYEQLQTAYDAFDALSETEQAEIDDTVFDELFDYFNGLVNTVVNKNILDYIESYSASHYGYTASSSIVIRDSDWEKVENETLIVDEEYTIFLNFFFEAGIEVGTYVYTFPEGITLTDASGSVTFLVNGSDINLGTWTIDSTAKTLTFDITNYETSISNVTISASASATFDNVGDEIEIGDITYKVIEDTEDHSASLHKNAMQISTDNNTISWVIEIDGGDNVGLAEQTIWDTIITDTHEYLEANIDSLTIKIQDNAGKNHTLSVDDVNYFNYGESGWQLDLPEEFVCVDCGETIELPKSDSTGWIVYIYYTTHITDSRSYVTYGNTVQFNGLDETGKISTREGSIDKTGIYKAGTTLDDSTVTWTIDAFIPGGQIYNWYIYDSEDVVIGSSRQQLYYNALGDDSTTITATIDNVEYNVPNLAVAANDGNDLIAWVLDSTSTTDGYAYGRTILFYTWDSVEGEWSLLWNISQDTYLTITYTSSVVYDTDGDGKIEDTDENLIEEYNAKDASLRNSVQLRNKGTNGSNDNLVAENEAKVDLPSVIDKELTQEPSSSNSWIAKYQITFNKAMADLSSYGSITLTDTMSSSLVLQKDSIVITAKDKDGNSYRVTDYTINYSNNVATNVATITLNQSALGSYEYTIVYNAAINGSGTVFYSNNVEVIISGETFEDEVGSKTVNDVSATSSKYSVTLTKVDAQDNTKLLSGAQFSVYNYETGTLLTTVTTDASGYATIETSTSQGVILQAHTIYYFVETKAPDGYQLDNTTKYYFWFCNVEGDCQTCKELKTALEQAEGESSKIYIGTYDSSKTEEIIEITVTNIAGKELPTTGGTGTLGYMTTGILLMSGAAFVLYSKKQKRKYY
ncbi:MAG: CHAP domain-containing protein [Erysipelotrichaceae bacterium]|nr:CHAP domain-containing protein [Erysipelotrichaceae bacterium]